MKRICPKCHFIGSGFNGSIVAVGLIIGTGLLIYEIFAPYSKGTALFILITYTLIGIYMIFRSSRAGRVCPSCNYAWMIYVDKPEAQEIIERYGLKTEDTLTNTCSSCGYKGIPNRKHPKLLLLLVIPYGFLVLLISVLLHNLVAILGSLLILGFGIYGVIWNKSTNNKCPSCNNKTYVRINMHEA
jgi:predicted RNA-binding Zn-ribbon protein involved in translation (DUF1610 family)